MRILLTGGTGFIGSHVVACLLKRGHTALALTRSGRSVEGCQVLQADLLDQPSVALALRGVPVDACLHLAWYLEPGRYLTAPENLAYLSASLDLARTLTANGCRRFLGTGTCFEYAGSPLPLREDNPTYPRSPYAVSKLATVAVLQQFCELSSMEFAWARLFYQYGPNEDARRLVPAIVNSLLREQPAELTTGEQVRDYLHVADVAAALVAVAESSLTGIVNIGSGQPVTIRELAETIGQIMGRPDLLGFGLRTAPADEPRSIVADNTRLREQTGWSPQFDLCSGLRHTVDWWKQNPR